MPQSGAAGIYVSAGAVTLDGLAISSGTNGVPQVPAAGIVRVASGPIGSMDAPDPGGADTEGEQAIWNGISQVLNDKELVASLRQDAEFKGIVAFAAKHNVKITFEDIEEGFVAVYKPGSNVIIVNRKSTKTLRERFEAFTHEMVHAVQANQGAGRAPIPKNFFDVEHDQAVLEKPEWVQNLLGRGPHGLYASDDYFVKHPEAKAHFDNTYRKFKTATGDFVYDDLNAYAYEWIDGIWKRVQKRPGPSKK
jgi:hypothetical protein